MEIRKLAEENAVEHEKLASQAFVFPFDEKEASPMPSELMLGAFHNNGQLCADMEIYDRVCFCGSHTLSCAAVGGVASKPEYRRGGAVRALLNEIENGEVLGKKWDISLLYPFSAAYYKKLGYASVGTKLCVKVPFRELEGIERGSNVTLFEGKNGAELLKLYNDAAKRYSLNFRRDDLAEWDKEPYSTNMYTYMWHNGEGAYRSYATFTLNRGKSEVAVKELYFADKEALLGILGFLRCFDGNFSTIVFECLPVGSPVLHYIADINKAEIKASPAGAVKVLDFESVLKKHVFPEQAGRFSIEITGKGAFEVTYQNGEAQIKKTGGKADLIADLTAASKLVTEGIKDETALLYLPGVQINGDVKDFVRAFPHTDIFFNDSF